MSRRFLLTALLGLFTVASFSLTGGGVPVMKTQASSCPDALNFKMKNIDGKSVDLCSYKGNVVLIVNVASKCGLTPQYEGLEALNQKYRSQGLRILGFPLFGEVDAPGKHDQITIGEDVGATVLRNEETDRVTIVL